MNFKNRSQAKNQAGVSYIGSINSSAKLVKNKKVSNNYTYIVYLAPADTSGYNVCLASTHECRQGCLATSGRAKMEICAKRTTIQEARIKKTRLFHEQREFFMDWMVAEMKAYQAKAKRDGYAFSARLNGTSDIKWEDIKLNGQNIMEIFPDVQFYDYTKFVNRFFADLPQNYQLTFSYTGRNEVQAKRVLKNGNNVAVIFNVKKGQPLPETWNGFPVVDGDLTDYRPNDGQGVVVGLRWKNIANKEVNDQIRNSKFVVQVEELVEA